MSYTWVTSTNWSDTKLSMCVRMFVRKFIGDSLYNHLYGYFL